MLVRRDEVVLSLLFVMVVLIAARKISLNLNHDHGSCS